MKQQSPAVLKVLLAIFTRIRVVQEMLVILLEHAHEVGAIMVLE